MVSEEMLNNEQVRLVQVAVRAAGIRLPHDDSRYRLLLAQYRDKSRRPLTSCRDLSREQMTDLLAVCEGMGWRHPGKADDYYRQLASGGYEYASYAQQKAIAALFDDLGYPAQARISMMQRLYEKGSTATLSPREAYNLIEALKAMLSRQTGRTYHNVTEVQEDMEVCCGQQEPAPF